MSVTVATAVLPRSMSVAGTVLVLSACGPGVSEMDAGAPDAPVLTDVGTDVFALDAASTDAAAVPELELLPAMLDLGVAGPGCTRTGELTLENLGGAPSGPLSFSLAGPDAASFSVSGHTCPATLPPAARCVVFVELAPVTTGDLAASLVVEDSGREVRSSLAARSFADGCGAISPRPMMLDFGTGPVGLPTVPQTVRVPNGGGLPLGTFSVALSGPHAASFRVARDTCSGATLAPGASCEIDVVMSATAPGALTASLDLMTTTGLAGSVVLTGRGSTGSDSVVEPATADFGSWALGERSAPTMFTIRNVGSDSTGVVTVNLSGANPADFVIDSAMSTCDGVPLPGGASCSVLVSFAPTASGARSGVLRFTAAPGGTGSAALAGTGL